MLRPGTHIPRSAWSTAILLTAIFAAFGVAATHDYLAWNRVRWDEIRAIKRDTNTPEDRIEGGFEYDNWVKVGRELREGTIDRTDRSTSVDRSQAIYRIAGSQSAGWDVVRVTPTHAWLPRAIKQIYVLKRSETSPAR